MSLITVLLLCATKNFAFNLYISCQLIVLLLKKILSLIIYLSTQQNIVTCLVHEHLCKIIFAANWSIALRACLTLTSLGRFHPHFLFQTLIAYLPTQIFSTATGTVSSPFKSTSQAPLDHV